MTTKKLTYVKTERICDLCKKPMGNSWHTETETGELDIFVHTKCSKEWKLKQEEKCGQEIIKDEKN